MGKPAKIFFYFILVVASIFATILVSVSQAAETTSLNPLPFLAKASFRAFNESCTSKISQNSLVCMPNFDANRSFQNSAIDMSRDAYLSAIAAERVADETCAIDFVRDVTGPQFSEFADQTLGKVNLLVAEMHNLMLLRTQLLATPEKQRIGIRQEIEKSLARLTILEDSIPLSKQSALRNLIMSYVGKAIPASFDTPKLPPPIDASKFKIHLKEAMLLAKSDLEKDRAVFEVGSKNPSQLSQSSKEALAQDSDLIESFIHRNPNLNLSAVACDVHMKYGLGAERRDQVLLVGGLALTGASWIVGAGAKLAGVLINMPARVAATASLISAQGARALTVVSIGASGPLYASAVHKSCFSDISETKIKTQPKEKTRCEAFSAENIEIQNCYTAGALAALGLSAQVLNFAKSTKAIDALKKVAAIKTANKQIESMDVILARNYVTNNLFALWRKKHDPPTQEAIDIAIANGRGEDVVGIYKSSDGFTSLFKDKPVEGGQAIAKSSQALRDLRREISEDLFKNSSKVPSKSLQQVTAERELEITQLGSLKTYRASTSEVHNTRVAYPTVGKNIDDFTDNLKNEKFLPQHQNAEDVPTFNYLKETDPQYSKIQQPNPQVKEAIKEIWNKLNDPKAFAQHTKSLAEDAAVEMKLSGDAKSIDALKRGELTETGVLKVLVKRQKAKGEDHFTTVLGADSKEFIRATTSGPILDKLNKNDPHSMTAHLLQRDYLDPVIWKATEGKPEIFWNYIKSRDGERVWGRLFDSGHNNLTSPELYTKRVNGLLKILKEK